MPVEFLSDEQVAAYGRFAGPPTRTQLERSLLLNDADRGLVDERRGDHTRLGFGVQLGTVRFLGTFLADPTTVPIEVAEYVAAQLGISDAACLALYAERESPHREHAGEIQRVYDYRDFPEAEDELSRFVAARCATSAEGPRALLDRAVAHRAQGAAAGSDLLTALLGHLRLDGHGLRCRMNHVVAAASTRAASGV
jgi:Domain of unknown function (DUF4158)